MKISDHCYTVTGLYCFPPWSANAGFIAGEKKTLVVDASANRLGAQTIHGYALAVAPSNDLLLVNTECHFDHMGGNDYFREKNVPIYGHRHFAERQLAPLDAITAWINTTISNNVRRTANEGAIAFKGTRMVKPDHIIDEECSFDLGGFEVEILFTPGHTKSNLSIYHRGEGILFCGDAVMQDHIPNLEEGNADDWKIWLASLEKIEKLPLTALVPGHGNVITGARDIGNSIARTRAVLREAISNNKAPTISA